VPVPNSCVAACTTIVPSAVSRASAVAGIRFAGYVAVDIPKPTSVSPSRMDRGARVRRDQPNRSAPRA
jgi:hypothetical protein